MSSITINDQSYQVIKLIDYGSFGRVYLVRSDEKREYYILKNIIINDRSKLDYIYN